MATNDKINRRELTISLGINALLLACTDASSATIDAQGDVAKIGPFEKSNRGSTFPSDANLINVHSFGARGDGINDDSDAILRAIGTLPAYGKDLPYLINIIYFPSGTYCVSDTILRRSPEGFFLPNLVIIGEDRATTIIKLSDRTPGFNDTSNPKAVIYTSSGLAFLKDPRDGGREYLNLGEGNEAFGNTVENITVDVGSGNPGAIGIDFLANNVGAVRNVTIKTRDRGWVGLSMARRWPGPALISNVTIFGFDIGIDTAYSNYSLTLNKVQIEGSKQYGIHNKSNVISFSDLKIMVQEGYGLANVAPDGLIVGIGGVISGKGKAPLLNNGAANLKDVIARNFEDTDGFTANGILDGVFQAEKRLSEPKWHLPVRSPPEPAPVAIDEWVNIRSFGVKPDVDSTAGFAAALKSEARVIYIPSGQYFVSQPFVVSDNIERIEGMFSIINVGNDRHPIEGIPSALFRTSATRKKPLFLNRLIVERRGSIAVIVDHQSASTLVLSDVIGLLGVGLLYRRKEGGPVFANNTTAGHTDIFGPAGVWFRQFNAEGRTVRLSNDGAPLWILGAKSEQTNTLIQNKNGADTEVVGAFIARIFPTLPQMPAFQNFNGRLVLSYAEDVYRPDAAYRVHLDSLVGDKRTIVSSEDLPRRGKWARMAPILSTDDLPR